MLHGIAYVGAFTALFAATIACVQTDIKRVLAFSTISQIGFMMVALGVSGYGGHEGLGYMAGMFHLFTHAMFKALLFLGAGAIIHAVHSNEMSHMGGLRKQMPITHITFLVACLAISGIPPFSGFFSKDEILTAAFMFAPAMGWVMSFIAAVTCVAGFIPFGKFVSSDGADYIIHLDWTVAGTSIAIALISIAVATVFYRKHSPIPDRLARTFSGLHRAASHRFYIDEVSLFITKRIIFNGVSRSIAWFDRHVIDGAMNGLALVTNRMSLAIRGLQSGQVQQYAFVFLVGLLLITVLVLLC